MEISKMKAEIQKVENAQYKIANLESWIRAIRQEEEGFVLPHIDEVPIALTDKKCREQYILLLKCVKRSLEDEINEVKDRIIGLASE